MNAFLQFLRNDDGTAAVEYAVMLALILVGIISAIQAVGFQTGGMWGGIITRLTAVGFFN